MPIDFGIINDGVQKAQNPVQFVNEQRQFAANERDQAYKKYADQRDALLLENDNAAKRQQAVDVLENTKFEFTKTFGLDVNKFGLEIDKADETKRSNMATEGIQRGGLAIQQGNLSLAGKRLEMDQNNSLFTQQLEGAKFGELVKQNEISNSFEERKVGVQEAGFQLKQDKFAQAQAYQEEMAKAIQSGDMTKLAQLFVKSGDGKSAVSAVKVGSEIDQLARTNQTADEARNSEAIASYAAKYSELRPQLTEEDRAAEDANFAAYANQYGLDVDPKDVSAWLGMTTSVVAAALHTANNSDNAGQKTQTLANPLIKGVLGGAGIPENAETSLPKGNPSAPSAQSGGFNLYGDSPRPPAPVPGASLSPEGQATLTEQRVNVANAELLEKSNPTLLGDRQNAKNNMITARDMTSALQLLEEKNIRPGMLNEVLSLASTVGEGPVASALRSLKVENYKATLGKLSENTFGSLSEKELEFISKAANRGFDNPDLKAVYRYMHAYNARQIDAYDKYEETLYKTRSHAAAKAAAAKHIFDTDIVSGDYGSKRSSADGAKAAQDEFRRGNPR